MNAPLELHSPFGGSVAARVLRCPASVSLTEKVPARLRKVIHLRGAGHSLPHRDGPAHRRERGLREPRRRDVGGYAIALDDVENALRPVTPMWSASRHARGGVLSRAVVSSFRPSLAPSALPTCSCASAAPSIVVDFKFGTGVRVLALYRDGDDDVVNGQLLFYAAGGRSFASRFFADVDNIVLTIVQPDDRGGCRDGVVRHGHACGARRVHRDSIAPPVQRRSSNAPVAAGRLVPFLSPQNQFARAYRVAA